jgi:hypothetical protein
VVRPLLSRVIGDHREAGRRALVSTTRLSLLVERVVQNGPVKGAPIGAAKRTLEGEDRSERMGKEGKQDVWISVGFSET